MLLLNSVTVYYLLLLFAAQTPCFCFFIIMPCMFQHVHTKSMDSYTLLASRLTEFADQIVRAAIVTK